MEHNIINTLKGDRVSSTYAEIYFDDTYCFDDKSHILENKPDLTSIVHETDSIQKNDEWTSPSDLLIGIVELKPPFTSKINRGKTHEGICRIGNEVLEHERSRFLKSFNKIIAENEAAWAYILKYEIEIVTKKVRDFYENIFKDKSKIMAKEVALFYQTNLQELETHLRSELQTVLQSSHAGIISSLNNDIKQKLQQQKRSLEDVLRKRLLGEVKKMNHYYQLLLRNEIDKNEKLIYNALCEKNDALKAFVRFTEADKITSNMYVMSLERKKCKVKKVFLQNYHNAEIQEKIDKIKDRRDIIADLKSKETTVLEINEQWEENIKKVLQLFLKFIGFSLKLLPEQATFLLDLEKMVVLQLNEIQKQPEAPQTLLLDNSYLHNNFSFVQCLKEDHVPCEKDPFVLIGDLSDPIPPRYGSRETLASDVDLPTIRLQRQFVYAKCHGYEDIKKILDIKVCPMCHLRPVIKSETNTLQSPIEDAATLQSTSDDTTTTTQTTTEDTTTSESTTKDTTTSSESTSKDTTTSSLLTIKDTALEGPTNKDNIIEDFPFSTEYFKRLKECPGRNCINWIRRHSVPELESYYDFTETNYERVIAILEKKPIRKRYPESMRPKDIVYDELPFSATKEKYHTVETQCSSVEDLNITNNYSCSCMGNNEDKADIEGSANETYDALTKRKISLQRLFNDNPDLLKLFTDECYDYKI